MQRNAAKCSEMKGGADDGRGRGENSDHLQRPTAQPTAGPEQVWRRCVLKWGHIRLMQREQKQCGACLDFAGSGNHIDQINKVGDSMSGIGARR
jgi:hypothetical protein